MTYRRMLAAVALLAVASAAHAEHFEYAVQLTGTYEGGGTGGCTPPFDQPGCPTAGSISGMMSFDTPTNGDGSWLIEPGLTDITNFTTSFGSFSTDLLLGGISVSDGSPSGSVQAIDESESLSFDGAGRTVSYSFGYAGTHGGTGSFTGTLSAVPEPSLALTMLAALAGVVPLARRRGRAAASRPQSAI
ncbi:hypothetical protein [Scleromatobacter humisilvae]|uniref:PEP-CTERM protein-sorting domain-containing protein n=1 Tax=Scleromatobacter humisilvae TaxID=2897159 RepID=A0A9X1YGF7_9BURK|nr:hypothetical protein [Scleromatobacter humisilvae]MCK9685844.1 hypothetical protein [Scleromatobacter humisilvae]